MLESAWSDSNCHPFWSCAITLGQKTNAEIAKVPIKFSRRFGQIVLRYKSKCMPIIVPEFIVYMDYMHVIVNKIFLPTNNERKGFTPRETSAVSTCHCGRSTPSRPSRCCTTVRLPNVIGG